VLGGIVASMLLEKTRSQTSEYRHIFFVDRVDWR